MTDPHPGHRRRRLHRLALRPHAARPARARATSRSPCSTSSPTPATRPTSTRCATTPASRFVQGDICDAELVGRADGRARRGRALRRRVPRRPLHRRRAPSSSAPTCVGTQTLLDAALGAGIETVRARLHRRGLRLDRRGLLARDRPAASPTRPTPRPRRPATCSPWPTTAPTAWTCASPAAPTTTGPTSSPRRSSRCSSPTCSTAARSRCTATAATSATGCTSTTTARASSWSAPAAAPGEVYNIGGGTELTNKELTGLLLDAVRRRLGPASSTSPTARATTAATPSTARKIRDELGYAAAQGLRAGPGRDRARGTATTAPGGSR